MQRATAYKDECQKRVEQLREELEQAEESLAVAAAQEAAAKETAAAKSREWAAMVRPEGGAGEPAPTPPVA
eukprot:1255334-Pyramimonas_sp.AAC.1